MGKRKVKVREEKRSLLLKERSEALKSRIHGPNECVRQTKTLSVWATDANLDA